MELKNYKEILDDVFPSADQINRRSSTSYTTNDIMQKQIFVYGKQGSGKTELMRVIADYLAEKYGEENINVRVSTGDLGILIREGLEDKLVNFLICDDATLEKIPRQTLVDFFRIRHLLKERTGRNNGLVVTAIISHRFHGVKAPELKTDMDLFLIKNSASNPYDHDVLKRFVGEELLENLKTYEAQRDFKPELKGMTIAYHLNEKFMTNFPLAVHNYLKTISDVVTRNIPKMDDDIFERAKRMYPLKDSTLDNTGTQFTGGLAKLFVLGIVFVIFYIILTGIGGG